MRKHIAAALLAACMLHPAGAISNDKPVSSQLYTEVITLVQDQILEADDSFHPRYEVTNLEACVMFQRAFADPELIPEDYKSGGVIHFSWLPSYIYSHFDESVNMKMLSEMLLNVKNLPTLQAKLYDMGTVENTVFTAYAYGFINELPELNEPVTYEQFIQIIYRAKYVNPQPRIPEPVHTSGVLISTEGYDDVTAAEKKQETEVSLLQIPEMLRNDFTAKGYQVILMPEKAYKDTWYNRWGQYIDSTACYSHEGRYILSTLTDPQILAHEFGHHLYWEYGAEEEYEPIYGREVNGICRLAESNYSRGSAKEGFADAYAAYVVKSDEMRAVTPFSYEYIDGLMNELRDA